MSARVVPETANRQDWPRLVAGAANDAQRRIALLEATPAGATLDLDGGNVAGISGSSFDFDGGGA